MKNLFRVFVLCCVFFTSIACWAGDDQVNINTADAQLLADVMTGVGLKKAEAIVAWRDANGKFQSLDDLLEVKGIGEALLAKNRDRLALK